ncbi:MAG: YihA family ribosome biogenesis GTP-binding protein [Deltaproteobacteria bacterium]|nr:YihA family ribosome biogenesis GTP-binding protein [Deltaproteobacteria bacterium]
MKVEFLKSAFREKDYPPPDKPEIAFAGKSNVGKSSLINVLVNRKGIARTSSKPGRTQAINFFGVEDRLLFVDLPGYGYARVSREIKNSWKGMRDDYLRKRRNLKAVVMILDLRRDLSDGDMDLLRCLDHYGITALIVLTKTDKLSRAKASVRIKELNSQLNEMTPKRPILFSAKTKKGREEIWKEINDLILENPQDHTP